MDFEIPDINNLPHFTVTALKELGIGAAAAYDSLRASLSAESVSEEDINDLEDLSNFMILVDDEIDRRRSMADRFNALPSTSKMLDDEEDEETAGDAAGEDEETGADQSATKTRVRAGKITAMSSDSTDVAIRTPGVADIARDSGSGGNALEGEVIEPDNVPKFTILAAADTGYSAGTELDDWLDVAKAFVARSRSHGGGTAQQSTVATIRREFGEFSITDGDDDVRIMRKIDMARDETRIPGGSLLAGVGWCAPSETIYTTCNQITSDGLLSTPEIGARRGGIRHNQGIEFDTIFGGGTGYNILTEAQVIADTTKTCAAIPCPSFVDDRLKVSVLCLTGDILQNRGYPEFVSEFVQGSIAAQAHNVNRQIIADIVADSTAVTLTGSAPWATDTSVVSQVMSAVEVAAVDIKYRMRLQRSQTLEVVFPYWLRAQMRADWIRRNAVSDANLADAEMDAMLTTRGVRAQWVYDWQDAFSATGVSGGPDPGSDTPIAQLPTSVSFIIYPAGTWVVARQDVIRLDTIYDSVNITTNKVTQLFLEDGFRAMRFCPVSRVYTVNICPNGDTGEQRAVTC